MISKLSSHPFLRVSMMKDKTSPKSTTLRVQMHDPPCPLWNLLCQGKTIHNRDVAVTMGDT